MNKNIYSTMRGELRGRRLNWRGWLAVALGLMMLAEQCGWWNR